MTKRNIVIAVIIIVLFILLAAAGFGIYAIQNHVSILGRRSRDEEEGDE